MPKKCNSSSALCRRPQSPVTLCCSFSEWNCSSTLSRNGASMHPRIRGSVHSSTSRDSSGRPPMQRVRRARSLERSSAAARSPIRNRLTSEHATVCLNTFGDGYLFQVDGEAFKVCPQSSPQGALDMREMVLVYSLQTQLPHAAHGTEQQWNGVVRSELQGWHAARHPIMRALAAHGQ